MKASSKGYLNKLTELETLKEYVVNIDIRSKAFKKEPLENIMKLKSENGMRYNFF